jgi:inner membrane protein YhjD
MKLPTRKLVEQLDGVQRRRAVLGFPLAVSRKYADDQGGYLAATITYYCFFSIFPLLLVFTTLLGFALHGNPHLQARIVNSALAQFPVIGHQLGTHSLQGSGLALGLGLAAALWAGMGAVLAAENAMDQLWGVPFTRRPGFLRARVQALALLLALAVWAIGGTVLAGAATVGTGYGIGWKILLVLGSTLLDFGLFWFAFRALTSQDVSWRMLRGGAAAAAVGYEALQLVGGYYVGHAVASAGNTYGTFALVIGLLSFIYLAVHITLLAAESNVVATRKLWPRSISIGRDQPATAADEAALAQRSKVEKRRQDQQISVRVPVRRPD